MRWVTPRNLFTVAAVVLTASANCYGQTSQSIPVLQGDPYAGGAPVVDTVQSTPLGYVIVGRDFGGDPALVRILENDEPVAESAVVGVSSQRISVLSIPQDSTSIVVEVNGAQSTAVQFEYTKPLDPPMSDMPVGEAPDDAELATANASMLNREAVADSSDDGAVESSDPESVSVTTAGTSPATPTVSGGDIASADLSREVMVLRNRLQSLEEQIYQLKKLIEER